MSIRFIGFNRFNGFNRFIRFTGSSTLIMLATVVPARSQTTMPAEPVIVTRGEAVIKRAPDRAWVTIATDARDLQAAEARKRGAEVMTAVQNALKGVGIPADAIRTTGFSLAPEMEWVSGRQRQNGYVVHNQIEVRVDDLDKISQVLDVGNATKSTALTIRGPRFDLKNREGAEHEALRQAVERAMGRAQAIAGGARRTLGGIVRVEDQSATVIMSEMPMQMRTANMAADKAETPITPGEIEIRAQVTLSIAIR